MKPLILAVAAVAAYVAILLASHRAPTMHVLDQPNCTAPDVSTLDPDGNDWSACPDEYRKWLSRAVIQI